MDALIYAALCLPAVLMILAGLLIVSVKKDSTMSAHHFTRKYDIKSFSKKIIKLFTITGIVFSVGGFLIFKELFAVGIAVLFVMLLVFVFSFASIYRKS